MPDGIALIIVLFVIGFLLIAAEAFIPGMVAGVVGGVFLLGAVSAVYVYYGAAAGVVALVLVALLTLVGFVIWLHLFPKTIVGRKLMLQTVQEGTVTSDMPEQVAVGDLGHTVTPLRPSGTARIGTRRVDVIASAEFLEEGIEIEVIEVEGVRVVVRRKDKLELDEEEV